MAYRNTEDQKAAAKRHYQNNKADYCKRSREWNRKTREAARLLIEQYKSRHPCADCGEKDIVVLEFDHRDSDAKEFNVGDMARGSYSLERLKAEIAKCDVRCANCHRRVTYYRRLAT